VKLKRPWGTTSYLDEGEGPIVLLLHPLAESGALWRTLLNELTPQYRVLAPDARGHGDSSWDGTTFTIPSLAEDAAALVEHVDAGPARVVSLSMGGCTAVALGVRRPDLVHSLVLADTTADYGPDRETAWGERAEKAVRVPREKQLTFQLDRWFSPAFLETDPAEVERVSRIFVDTDSDAHAAACLAMGAFDDSSRLSEITAPTLVLVGADDYATPPTMAQALHEGIAGSELHVLPDTRHMSLVESVEARRLVRRHLER
jgi:3-oxoadipate enol-lactonase